MSARRLPRHLIWIGAPKPKPARTATISPELDPAMQFVLRKIHEIRDRKPGDPRSAWWRVEAGAGLGKDAIRSWLYRNPRSSRGPSIGLVRSALNELGYDLEIVPLASSTQRRAAA